jgi:predicted aldo/keto reductase-like oxidoreductase
MIATARFGRTGHLSTRTIFGASALSHVTQADADRTLEVLLSYGINHIDTAFSYGDSELRLAPWLQQHGHEVFLGTKTLERTYAKAKEGLHRSLERLQVSSVDLIQLHYLVDPAEWEVAMGPGGALEALIEARAQGLTRYIGVTGHDVAITKMHQRSLSQFDFDSILLPYSYVLMQNAEYAAGVEALLAHCQQHDVAVQTIKSLTRRPWAADQPRTAATWYEPLTEQAHIDHAVQWVLGQPGVFLNTAGDIDLLPKVLDAASRFVSRPADAVMQADLDALAMSPLFV